MTTSAEARTVTVRLGGSLDEALSALGSALGFPDHYGNNLDALADCLTDLDEPTTVELVGWESFAWAMPEDWADLRGVLDRRTTNVIEGVQGSTGLAPFRVVAGVDEGPVRAL